MFMQVVVLASLLAISQAGLLLGGGIGGGLGYGGVGIASGAIGYGGGYGAVDYYAPPKYEYNYGVKDYHTGDWKEKVESRVGGLTQTQYAWGQGDRRVQEARVFASH